jgi:hypothetical protein
MSSSFGNKLARALISTRCNLKSCKSIKITFNPWQIETKSIRDFYHYLYTPNMRISNDKCKLVVDFRSDLIDPNLEVTFSNYFKIFYFIIILITFKYN